MGHKQRVVGVSAGDMVGGSGAGLAGSGPAPWPAQYEWRPPVILTVDGDSVGSAPRVMSGEMVYYNPLMYRGAQQPSVQVQSYPGWYPPPPGYHHQPQQQYLSCMHDAAGTADQQWSHHHFSPGDWAVDPEPVLPSPSVTVQSTSGGSELSSPGLPQNSRPPPARSPYEWIRKTSYQNQPNPGKTRTKDKYRVVYTDHQRLELEKEFHYSRYITIRRKAELATNLALSERQVKIWFQNRRAKERKQLKKREELLHKEKMQQLAML